MADPDPNQNSPHATDQGSKPPSLVSQLLGHYSEVKGQLSLVAALGIISAIAEALSLVAIVPLIQAAADGDQRYQGDVGPWDINVSVWFILAVALAMTALTGAATLVAIHVTSRANAAWGFRRRIELVSAFGESTWETQATDRSGRLVSLAAMINQASGGIQALSTLARAAFTFAVFVGGAVLVDYRGALLILGAALLLGFAVRPLMSRTAKYSDGLARLHVELSEELASIGERARETKLFNVEEAGRQKFDEDAASYRDLRIRSLVTNGTTPVLYRTASMLIVFGLAALALAQNELEITGLGVVAILMWRSISYGLQVQNSRQLLRDVLPVADMLAKEIARYEATVVRFGSSDAGPLAQIRLSDVAYHYPGTSDRAIQQLTFTIQAGESVGIVGASGAGKSTLAQVLLRLRPTSSGHYSVNGTAAQDISADSWARLASMVPQDPPLIRGTVTENVKFYRRWITDEAVISASRAAGVDEFASLLPSGYQTIIGNDAHNLSGGQIQRIAIARALAGSPEMIVLDEPTSALDADSENVVTDTLTRFRGETTLVIIAHRLSTLQSCDTLVVMNAGQVQAAGPAAELWANNEYLARALATGSLEQQPDESP